MSKTATTHEDDIQHYIRFFRYEITVVIVTYCQRHFQRYGYGPPPNKKSYDYQGYGKFSAIHYNENHSSEVTYEHLLQSMSQATLQLDSLALSRTTSISPAFHNGHSNITST